MLFFAILVCAKMQIFLKSIIPTLARVWRAKVATAVART